MPAHELLPCCRTVLLALAVRIDSSSLNAALLAVVRASRQRVHTPLLRVVRLKVRWFRRQQPGQLNHIAVVTGVVPAAGRRRLWLGLRRLDVHVHGELVGLRGVRQGPVELVNDGGERERQVRASSRLQRRVQEELDPKGDDVLKQLENCERPESRKATFRGDVLPASTTVQSWSSVLVADERQPDGPPRSLHVKYGSGHHHDAQEYGDGHCAPCRNARAVGGPAAGTWARTGSPRGEIERRGQCGRSKTGFTREKEHGEEVVWVADDGRGARAAASRGFRTRSGPPRPHGHGGHDPTPDGVAQRTFGLSPGGEIRLGGREDASLRPCRRASPPVKLLVRHSYVVPE